MNKNLVIGIIVVVLLALGWFLFGNKKQVTPPPTTETTVINNQTQAQTATETNPATTAPATVVTVTYDGKTFSPATVTVKQGESVTFVNSSTGGMSVASNPHPIHTIYPEFDQYKTSAKGQKTFTFVFQKAGSWGFHNHLNPIAGGTIVVSVK